MMHSFSGEGTAGEGGEGTAINGHDAHHAHAHHGGHAQSHGNHIVAPVPVPIQQRGFNPTSDTFQSPNAQDQQSRPAHRREPTSSADDVLSTSRSRRLLSGYLFGNPPSPHETDDSTTTGTTSALGQPIAPQVPALDERHSSPTRGPPNPTAPSQTRDSTPVSTVSSSPDLPESGNLTARMADHTLDDPSDAPADASASTAESRRRRQSRARDREIGYDALSGLNDGEADADENAPQANFGTRPYLLGEEGPSGEYRFPRHRLRTRMKGESRALGVMVERSCRRRGPSADRRRVQDPHCHRRMWKFQPANVPPSPDVRDGQGRGGRVADVRDYGGVLFAGVSAGGNHGSRGITFIIILTPGHRTTKRPALHPPSTAYGCASSPWNTHPHGSWWTRGRLVSQSTRVQLWSWSTSTRCSMCKAEA